MRRCFVVNNNRLSVIPEHNSEFFDALRGGFGVFETMQIIDGRAYNLDQHLDQLDAGLSELSIEPVERTILHETVVCNAEGWEGLLRLSVFKSVAYLIDIHQKANVFVMLENIAKRIVTKPPISVLVSQRVKPNNVPTSIKSCNRMLAALYKMEARQHGCFESIMIDSQNRICSVSGGNIFWIKDNILYTPSAIHCNIRAGTTRQTIIELSPYPVIVGEFTLADLLEAQMMFITNVSWQALEVASLMISGKKIINFANNNSIMHINDALSRHKKTATCVSDVHKYS